MNVRPGMSAVVISTGDLVDVLEENFSSHLLCSFAGDQVWPVRAISPGTRCLMRDGSYGTLAAGEVAFCADRFLRPVHDPDSHVMTTHQHEVTA